VLTATVPAALDGQRLDRVVAMVAEVSRREAAELVRAGAVRVGGVAVVDVAHRLAEGDDLAVEPRDAPDATLAPDPDVPLVLVHVDDDVLVVDKPAGIVVHPGSGQERGTLVQGLLARFPELAAVGAHAGDPRRPGIVHRLDKGTSGLMAVARTPEAYDVLVGALARREVRREYRALVWGVPEPRRGVVDAPIGRSARHPTRMAVSADGRPARTRYEVLEEHAEPTPTALLSCRLETGRTHQIRVHLAAVGHPVVGDDTYRGARAVLDVARPFLHAHRLAFAHPRTGAPVDVTSPLPADLVGVLARLR
jgi:23S rRNA pseudouridine1911/1915/1917 synthase